MLIGNPTPYCDILIGEKFIKAWQKILRDDNPEVKLKKLAIYKDLEEVFGYEKFEIVICPENKIIAKINSETIFFI